MAQTMTCEHCRKAVPVSDVRYVLKGKDSRVALCTSCRTKYKPEADKGAKAVPAKSNKVPYMCVRCHYKFKYNPKSEGALRCPFCGHDDKLMKNTAPDAETLLRTIHDD